MSFKRDGDDYSALNYVKKRRVEELLTKDIPDEEACLTKNGRFACLVCFNHPVVDTVDMLCIHREGKRHKFCSEKFLSKRKEYFRLVEKRRQETISVHGNNKEIFKAQARMQTKTSTQNALLRYAPYNPISSGAQSGQNVSDDFKTNRSKKKGFFEYTRNFMNNNVPLRAPTKSSTSAVKGQRSTEGTVKPKSKSNPPPAITTVHSTSKTENKFTVKPYVSKKRRLHQQMTDTVDNQTEFNTCGRFLDKLDRNITISNKTKMIPNVSGSSRIGESDASVMKSCQDGAGEGDSRDNDMGEIEGGNFNGRSAGDSSSKIIDGYLSNLHPEIPETKHEECEPISEFPPSCDANRLTTSTVYRDKRCNNHVNNYKDTRHSGILQSCSFTEDDRHLELHRETCNKDDLNSVLEYPPRLDIEISSESTTDELNQSQQCCKVDTFATEPLLNKGNGGGSSNQSTFKEAYRDVNITEKRHICKSVILAKIPAMDQAMKSSGHREVETNYEKSQALLQGKAELSKYQDVISLSNLDTKDLDVKSKNIWQRGTKCPQSVKRNRERETQNENNSVISVQGVQDGLIGERDRRARNISTMIKGPKVKFKLGPASSPKMAQGGCLLPEKGNPDIVVQEQMVTKEKGLAKAKLKSHQPKTSKYSEERKRELEKHLQLTSSGWVHDPSGEWVRDGNVEFDSDEDAPTTT